jgi:uncharacterized protein (TIGR02246 family)
MFRQSARVAGVAIVLCAFTLPADAQPPDFVLKAACIGGARNSVSETAVAADGTISRQGYTNRKFKDTEWQVVGRDPKRVARWLKQVDATKMRRVVVPASEDRNPCKVGSSRPCHLVRRKGKQDYYACSARDVMQEMMGFDQWTDEPRAEGSDEVVQQWYEAFRAADVDALVKLLSEDALFTGSDSSTVLRGRDEIRTHLANLFLGQKPRDDTYMQQYYVALSEDVLLVAGNSNINMPRETRPVRVTFVVARRDKQWLIVHFHSSAVPR